MKISPYNDIENSILKTFDGYDDGDFQVFNSCQMNNVREKYGIDTLREGLTNLENKGLIEVNTEAQGTRIFKL
jgi:hypothetical protein